MSERMTDLERAADLLARAVPFGFDSPEARDKCQSVVDSLAVEILRLSGETDEEEGTGLTALVVRMEARIEELAMRAYSAETDLDHMRGREALRRADELLARLREKDDVR